MEQTDRLSKILNNTPSNSYFGWMMVVLLFLLAAVNLMNGRLRSFILMIFLICIIIAPAVLLRNLSVMPSWYFILLAVVPIVGSTTTYYFFLTSIPIYVSLAAIALLAAAEINWFTPVRMHHNFVILLVVTITLATSGIWHLLLWLLDMNFATSFLIDGQSQETINEAVMYEFMSSTAAGIISGFLFSWYFRKVEYNSSIGIPQKKFRQTPNHLLSGPPAPIHKLLSISYEKQALATSIMQVSLFILMITSIVTKDIHSALNAMLGLIITFLPSIITHRFNVPLDPGLALWITLAIYMHALGTFAFYEYITIWDNITHALSASVIAAGGYVIIRAIDIYYDDIEIPPRWLFLFILLFIIATGILWEIMEFLTDELAAELGYKAVLTQNGINDTMRDLLFNIIGATLAATWGTVYLSEISHRLAHKLEEFSNRNADNGFEQK
ncbi:MAG: hypothetical protein ACQESU_02375 [Halobacteriota archaeon]